MDNSCYSDELLVQQFMDGDNQSFDKLIAKYQVLVFSLCLNLLGSEDLAGALVKEVFVEISRRVKENRDTPFEVLVHRVTYDLALSKMVLGFQFHNSLMPYSAADRTAQQPDNPMYGKH